MHNLQPDGAFADAVILYATLFGILAPLLFHIGALLLPASNITKTPLFER
jgi:hypothetical protein